MREREADDTSKPGGPPPPEGDDTAGSYYYDDATGYEIFNPDEDREEDGGSEAGGVARGDESRETSD